MHRVLKDSVGVVRFLLGTGAGCTGAVSQADDCTILSCGSAGHLGFAFIPIPAWPQRTTGGAHIICCFAPLQFLLSPMALSEPPTLAWGVVILAMRLNTVSQDTKLIFLRAGAALDGVTAAGNMLMLKADTSPEPFLLSSIFSKLLAVICV